MNWAVVRLTICRVVKAEMLLGCSAATSAVSKNGICALVRLRVLAVLSAAA